MTDCVVVERDGYEFVEVPVSDLLRWAGVPPRFRGVRWDREAPSLISDRGVARPIECRELRAKLLAFSTWSSSDPETFVVLHGPRGRGKTTYAAATIRRVTHLRPRWVEWPKLVADVADSWGGQGEGFVLDPIVRCSFLVIDDFGKELTGRDDARMTTWQKRIAFEVINGRYTRELPTLITTELGDAEMSDRLDAAITSRLRGDGRWIDLGAAPDYRTGGQA